MKLSFIIPLYNTEQYIGKCLDSVLDCDLDESQYEVIVVNDGSTDNGSEIVNGYASKHSNIRVFHQENQGQSVARNFGIKEAKGDFIWFVDSDDYVDATNISSILDLVVANNIEICKFEMKVFGKNGSSWKTHMQSIEYGKVFKGEHILINNVPVGSVCNSIFSREFLLINNLLFYPGIFHEDCDFSIRSIALAEQMMYVNQHLYVYRYNENSNTRSQGLDRKMKSHVSDVFVASNIHQFVEQTNSLSIELKEHLASFANSIIKGRLVSYITKNDQDSIELYKAFVDKATQLGMYPINTKNTSLSNKFLCFFLSSDSIMSFLIRLRNIF